MNTQVDVMKFSEKLRAQLRKLQAERPKQLKAFEIAVEKWQREMIVWILANAERRVNSVTRTVIRENSHYSSREYPDVSGFFRGCPPAPKAPSDAAIRKIQNALRHIAITGQKTIQVSTDEIASMFGEYEED